MESNCQKVFYSDIDARIGKIHVKEGDFVKKGDVIISYDSEDLERLETITNLQAQADQGSYVFVARDGKATKEFVECGIRNEEMVEIKSGLSEGTLVVWKDTLELADGMGVKVNN